MSVTFEDAPRLIRSSSANPKFEREAVDEAVMLAEGSPRTVKPQQQTPLRVGNGVAHTGGQAKRTSWQVSAAAPDEQRSSDWLLLDATEFSLVKKKHGQLAKMCEDRGLLVQGETGLTKRDMIMLLLHWRNQKTMPPSIQPPKPMLEDTATIISALDISSQATESTSGNGNDSAFDSHSPTPTPKQSFPTELDSPDLSELDALKLTRIQAKELKKGSKIGSGGFKDVYKGKYLGKYRVAIADIRGQISSEDIKEIRLLKDFRHPNVVCFVGVCVPESPSAPVQIVSELCLNGDLFHYIRHRPVPSLEDVLKLMLGSAKGVLYLHSYQPPILHRDLKSLNILIDSQGGAKINDFGLARVKNSVASLVRTACGTLNWQAPELWCPEPSYTFSVDVYSLALVYWEILCWHLPEKRYPFQGMNEHAIYLAVGTQKLRPSTSALKQRYGSIIINLVHAMWAADPSSRPSLQDVVDALEWMIQQGPRITSLYSIE